MNNEENYNFSELTNQELDQALYEILKDKDNWKSIDSLKKMKPPIFDPKRQQEKIFHEECRHSDEPGETYGRPQ